MADPLDIFIAQLRKLPKHTWPEVYQLGVRWRDEADEEARQALVHSVLPYAVKMAKRYRYTGIPFEDLVGLACDGVVDAVDKFDPDKGRLTTYTTWCVNHQIWRYKDQDLTCIHIPAHLKRYRGREDDPTVPAYVKQADSIRRGVASLDSTDTDGRSLSGSLVDTHQRPDQEAMHLETRALLHGMIDLLPEMQREVILGRLNGLTLQAIGWNLGVSKERVRQIETEAQVRLRALADRHKCGSLILEPKPMPLPTDAPAIDVERLDLSNLNLTQVLATVPRSKIQDAIDEEERIFAAAKAHYQNQLKFWSVLLKACEARDGVEYTKSGRKKRDVGGLGAGEPGVYRTRGRMSNRATMIVFLYEHGPSDNKTIIDGTGIVGSSVSSVLVTNNTTFMKRDGKWDLTRAARDAQSRMAS
jgi:RNA polymerase sigma factor (sigma-70 family)